MTRFFPLKFATVTLGLGVLALLPLHAQDKKSTSTEKSTKAADGEEEKEGKGLQINKLLPLNKPNLRVRIPGFDGGKLSTMIEAATLTRIDDANLRLEDATIQMVPQELTIKLRSALYNTEVAVLSSNESTTISSKQFTMVGDSMDFDTKTGKGQMIGKTRMLIHNVDAMSGGNKAADKKD
ncbi:MAG: hypothetical protein ACI8XO_003348, partial [Verrucomicrobiales bacterium]